jgi:hypothetical protein
LISPGTNDVVGFLSCVPGASQYRGRGSANDRLWFFALAGASVICNGESTSASNPQIN